MAGKIFIVGIFPVCFRFAKKYVKCMVIFRENFQAFFKETVAGTKKCILFLLKALLIE